MDVITMKLDTIQPSQLYISSEKLAVVMEEMNTGGLDAIKPMPVKRLGDQVIFTDGHTRALAAYLNGCSDIPVYWDNDALDWEAYAICVEWCKEERIYTIAGLKDRVVPPDEYEVVWCRRCRKMQEGLKEKRDKQK